MTVAGAVANRVTPSLWPGGTPFPDEPALAAALAAALGPGAAPDLAARLARTLADQEAAARVDAREVSRLLRAVGGAGVVIPRLEEDVHDLAGLARMAELL